MVIDFKNVDMLKRKDSKHINNKKLVYIWLGLASKYFRSLNLEKH
ncbi:hypothetical protein RT0155 [Rickettsia typhi str. Wilmington]|uniref:Uncharacterized protein n=1 Tax=Rickettsia typhi (strain ATCC VR-144 / Wilmington) TaxID=257363 RepID=Q68XK3_RICTY|nr:hypothetical protein RT0155 [Rickettsia typhi str. Wilmington]